MDQYPKRKNPRIKNYDYSSNGYYFVTICTHQKNCIFGQPHNLNRLGRIAAEGLDEISSHFAGVEINKYVVMPNHIHAIIVLNQADADLSVIVGAYKSYVSKKVHEADSSVKLWQTSFHDHVIRSQRSYEKIWEYIETNPQKWEEDCFHP